MENEFISYKQALALKELGFDEPCWAWWHIEDCDTRFCYSEQRSPIINSRETEIVGLPLYQQAFRWFREKYELYQAVYADKRADDLTLLYKVHVYKLNEELSEYAYRWAKTYEEAEQACLDKLIEIAKTNK